MSTAGLPQPKSWEIAIALPRLARIETRRSLGFWAVPVLIAIAWFASRQDFDDGVTLWVWTSASIGFNLLVIGPLIGGLAAWEAGRERRRGMGDLLATTPRPPISRDIGRWVAVTAWGAVAYLMFGSYQFVEALREATWGGPDFSPMVVGLVGLGAYTAVGYALGVLAPSRFIVPLVPLLLLGLFQFVPIGITDRNRMASRFLSRISFLDPEEHGSAQGIRFLSPYSFLNPEEHGVDQGIWPDISVALVLWLGGLAAAAMAIVGIRRTRSIKAMSALSASVVVASVGAIWVLRTDYSAEARAAATIPYEPACIEASVPVCTHPASSAVLEETGAVVETVMKPLVGIEGTPSRIASLRDGDNIMADGTLALPFYSPSNGSEQLAQDLALSLFTSGQYREDCFVGYNNAQYAVAEALLRRGRWSLQSQEGPSRARTCETEALWENPQGHDAPSNPRTRINAMEAKILAAADRFAALSVEERREWFMTHYADLRAGNLTLEDLP